MLNTNYTKDCKSSSYAVQWSVNSTSKIAHQNFDKFMSAKPKYTKKALLKQESPDYHSIIKIFIKFNVDIVAKHLTNWNYKIHLEKRKKTLFVKNYKSLLDREMAAIKNISTNTLERVLFSLNYHLLLHHLLSTECYHYHKSMFNTINI